MNKIQRSEPKRLVMETDSLVVLIKETLHQKGKYRLYVTGYSMSPTLRPHTDSVELKEASSDSIKRGDIVFAKRKNGQYMLHRVHRIEKGKGLWLNGDGQQWVELVRHEDVIALVSAIYRKEHYISVSNAGYRIYVCLWRKTRPFRDFLVKLKKLLKNTK